MQHASSAIIRADSWSLHGSNSLPTSGALPAGLNTKTMADVDAEAQAPESLARYYSAPLPSGQPTLQPRNDVMPTMKSAPVGQPSAPGSGLQFRQESLDAITSSELTRTKTLGGSQNLFNDVLEQLSAKEESLPEQAALYTLPSMQFLESLLDEMDSRSQQVGVKPPEPPLYLPIDSFDLPGLDNPGSAVRDLAQLGLPPLPAHRSGPAASAPPGSGTMLHSSTSTQGLMHAHGLPPPPPFGSFMPVAPTAGSAAPSPDRMPNQQSRHLGPAALARRAAALLQEEMYEFDEAEVSLQTSKSGRMRKVTLFTGNKRKAGDAMTHMSAPAALAGAGPMSPSVQRMSDSGMHSAEDDDDEDARASKKAACGGGKVVARKGRRTVCLNCGSYQTPQWRCGPLGPRTLCNACGVRYKKGLPLNCWPLKDGMVLPPGAVLPPGVQVPEGMNIITQTLECEL